MIICFLGPDGAGKSTIIKNLVNESLPFELKHYFHLKPIPYKESKKKIVSDPHKYPPYSSLKSYLKLVFLVFQYNFSWIRYILTIKNNSSLIIFDRFFDDLLVDHRRYRYGGSIKIAAFFRKLIPRPDIYFILTAKAEVIFARKQEIPYEELKRQINGYHDLIDNERYIGIDVDRIPEEIVREIITKLPFGK